MSDRVCVVVAAKNEGDNIDTVVSGAAWWGDVVVVDNASSDQTTFWARAAGAHVIQHARDEGIARSYLGGMDWALGRGYDRIVQLDAGLSFDPSEIGALLAVDADLVIGKRPPGTRKAVSLAGSLATRALTGMPFTDATSGFRAWKASTLEMLAFWSVECRMHGFQIEMLWQAWTAGLSIAEVPVSYRPGRSSANMDVALEALGAAWRIGKNRWRR